MEWTVTQKTFKHLHNIGQAYSECLHHMIPSNQQNSPLLCCSGCANSTNFLPWNFRVWVLHHAYQTKVSIQNKLTREDSPAKAAHLPRSSTSIQCAKKISYTTGAPCARTQRQPHFSRGVSLQLEGMNLGQSTGYMAKKEHVSIDAVMVYNT
jgi:hypothetical protein